MSIYRKKLRSKIRMFSHNLF